MQLCISKCEGISCNCNFISGNLDLTPHHVKSENVISQKYPNTYHKSTSYNIFSSGNGFQMVP